MPVSDVIELFEASGRDEAPFFGLVDAFYRRVETDHALRSLYPADLAPGKQHLSWFLIQRFGGPAHFNNRRGAPMLRRRHMEFEITREVAMRWFGQMSAAIDEIPLFAENREIVLHYFEDAAIFLINHGQAEQGPLTRI